MLKDDGDESRDIMRPLPHQGQDGQNAASNTNGGDGGGNNKEDGSDPVSRHLKFLLKVQA